MQPEEKEKAEIGVLRLRFIAGVCLFIVPALLCLGSMLKQPFAFSSWIQKAHDAQWVLELKDASSPIEQHFDARKPSVERLDIKFETHDIARKGQICVELWDGTTDTKQGSFTAPMQDIRNAVRTTLTFDAVPLEEGHDYYWRLWLEPEEDGFTGIYYMPEDWLEEIVVGWDAYYEGTEQPYYFAMDAYGR